MGAQADILAYIAGGGARTPKYGDVEKEQLGLQETRAKARDLKIAEEQRLKEAKDVKLYDMSLQQAAQQVGPNSGNVDVLKVARNLYIKGGGGNKVLMAAESGWAKIRQEAAKATDDELKASGLAAEQLAQGLVAFKALSPEQKAIHAPELQAELIQKGFLKPDQPMDEYAIDRLIAGGVTHQNLTQRMQADVAQKRAATESAEKELEMRLKQERAPLEAAKTTAETARIAAETARTEGELAGSIPISQTEQARIDAQRATAEAAAADRAADNARQERMLAETVRNNQTQNAIAARNAATAERRAAIAGQTAPPAGKPLPQAATKDLEKRASMRDQLDRFVDTFKDEYAGNTITGDLESQVGRIAPGLVDAGVSDWWTDYQTYRNDVRHGLFGGALTKNEQVQFDKQDINPRMDPGEIRKNLARQKEITDGALARQARVYAAGGYNKDQIEEYLGAPVAAAEETVRMMAPNGQIKPVPKSKVEAFKKAGAKVVGN